MIRTIFIITNPNSIPSLQFIIPHWQTNGTVHLPSLNHHPPHLNSKLKPKTTHQKSLFSSKIPCFSPQNPTPHKTPMSNFQFKKGTKVETSIEEEGFRGAWFPGTVVSKKDKKIMVEYDTLLAENGKTPLKEKVDLVNVRPIPPRETKRVYGLNEEVDVFYNDGWWEGVVTQVLENGDYSVYFRPTRDQFDFKDSDLRLHREWVGDKWVPPLDDDDEAAQLTDEKVHQSKEESPFSEGSLVEVSSDEDGFEGAWFAATVIKVIGKNKFLVEYRDLKTDDDKDFVREKVDTMHIRPRPPEGGKPSKYKQFEEVDALYNDGWWVGIISKVLDDSKYLVFFRSTDELLEFKDEDLRLHQDWINGKWVRASKALNFSE